MNSLDLVIIIVTSFFLIRGLFRGFILELTIVIGIIAGYLIALNFHALCAVWLTNIFNQIPGSIAQIISFSVIFIAVNIVLRVVAGIITKTLKFAMLGWLNRLLGAVFGIIKSTLILGIIVFLINLIPFSDTFMEKAGKKDSVFYPILELIGPELYKQVQNTNTKNLL